MNAENKPLSPHLQIYRLPMLAWLSITHRITGMFISVAAILLPGYLWAIAMGPDVYGCVQSMLSAWYGQVFLFCVSTSLIYHTLSGIRHLIWDMGMNLEVNAAEKSGYIVIILTLTVTALIWYFGVRGLL